MTVSSARTSEATFRMTFPDNSVIVWKDLPVGSRKIFEFDGREYYFTFLDGRSFEARVEIEEKSDDPGGN